MPDTTTREVLVEPLSVPVVKAVARAVRDAINRRFTVDSCVASTAVLIDVLTHLAVEATPEAVWVAAHNDASLRHMRTSPGEPFPDEAWSVGVAPGQTARPGKWPGHLVALVHGPQRTWLVDTSADQFSRPHRGLVVTGPVVKALPAEWADGVPCVARLLDTDVTFRFERSDDQQWRDATDWDRRGKNAGALCASVDEALSTLRTRGAVA